MTALSSLSGDGLEIVEGPAVVDVELIPDYREPHWMHTVQ